jgi:hypothetical protein
VEHGRRIYGVDNLGGWHEHPLDRPEEHRPCAEPTLDSFLRVVQAIP